MNYHFRVFNNNANVLVTVPTQDEEYAKYFARRCLRDFYDKTDEEVKNLQCEYICGFVIESIVNLEGLNNNANKSACEMKALEFDGSYFHNCSNCNESYGYNKSFDGKVFKFCPSCGSEIKEWL